MELVTLASAATTAGILAAGASRLAIAGWRRAATAYTQHSFQYELRHSLEQQADRARMAGLAQWQNTYGHSAHGQNSSWRVMQVMEIVDESEDVRSFYLQDPLNLDSITDFKPGQFLMIRPALGGGHLPPRCYSLSDVPGKEWYRISVKRQSYQAAQTASLSNWLHDHVQTGDCLLVAGPHGEFVVEDSVAAQAPLAFLAAGIGITPVLSMLKAQLLQNKTRQMSIFFQAQDTQHWPFGDLLHNWATQCPALQVASFFSRVAASDLPMVVGGSVATGKFSAPMLCQSLSDPLHTHFYMCGPDPWMREMAKNLEGLAIPTSQIHFESFTGKVESNAGAEPVADWEVEFLQSDLKTQISNRSSTVLTAAIELGINVQSVCHSGACGSCKLKLLKGSVRYARQPSCSHAANEVVACIAQPVGTVQIDA